MEIVFGEETKMQGSTLRTHAIVDGRQIECKADMEVIAAFDEQAKKGRDFGSERYGRDHKQP